jgi:RHS repeat-associated protein
LEQTGSVNNNITYAGYQYDSETGLYYLNARYYDSKIARFLSEDTFSGYAADPLSLNLYTYCSNNPIIYIDPTGHWQQGDEALNDEAKAKIIALTNAYYEATTKTEKDAISKQANDIRSNDANKQAKTTPITIECGYEVNNIVDTAVSTRGWMTKDDWNKVTASMGVTYTTDSKTSFSPTGAVKDTNIVTSFGRTDIGVNTSMNYTQNTASSSISLKYNLSNAELLFVSQLLANEKSMSLEQSICLLDTLEINEGSISKNEAQKYFNKNIPNQTAYVLEALYRSSLTGKSVGQIDIEANSYRIENAFTVAAINYTTRQYGLSINVVKNSYQSYLTAANQKNLNLGKPIYEMTKGGKTIGYHATLPQYVDSIKSNGFRESVSGRAGGAGIYVNNTPEGAIAEYRKYNPNGPEPVILRVEYQAGTNVMIENPGAHIKGPLPINGDTLTFESTQMKGTYNTIVRNGSVDITGTLK